MTPAGTKVSPRDRRKISSPAAAATARARRRRGKISKLEDPAAKISPPPAEQRPGHYPLKPVVVRFPAGLLFVLDKKIEEREKANGFYVWRKRPDRNGYILDLVAQHLRVWAYDGRPRAKDE